MSILFGTPFAAQQYFETEKDQFGNDMDGQPSFTWSVDDTSYGTVDSGGLFTAKDKDGPTAIKASADGITGTATVVVSDTVTINFDDLAVGTAVADQYADVTFSADEGDTVTVEPDQNYGTTGTAIGIEPPNADPGRYKTRTCTSTLVGQSRP